MAKKLEQITTPDGIVLPIGSSEITPEDSLAPVYLVPISDEEVAFRQQQEQEAADEELARIAAENAKQSALTKLQKLGLTEDEAKAIAGI